MARSVARVGGFVSVVLCFCVALAGCGNPPSGGSNAVPPVADRYKALVSAFDDLQMSVAAFRSQESIRTNFAGIINDTTYRNAFDTMMEKKNHFESLLAKTSTKDFPELASLRASYGTVSDSWKAYLLKVAPDGKLKRTPNAWLTIGAFGDLQRTMSAFEKSLGSIKGAVKNRSASAPAAPATPPASTSGPGALVDAEKAMKDAYQRYTDAVSSGESAEKVKELLDSYQTLKTRFDALKGQ